MRRLLYLAALSMLLVAMSASVALGQSPQGTEDLDCGDFVSFAGNPSQFQAQQFFDANDPAQDPYNLDADGDGIACEGLESGAPEDMAASQQPTATPEPAQTTADQYTDDTEEMTSLPDTGGFSLSGIAAGAGALLVAGGVLLGRRLS